MTEEVNTGGLHKFVYNKGHNPKLTKEQEKEIQKAWEEHYIKEEERREKRRLIRNKIILFIILALLLFLSWKYILKP